jgi:tetratricopeptide (TPR) repeat protein
VDSTEREAWRRADELLAELLELAPAERRAAAAARDLPDAVRAHLLSLLAAAEDEGGPLDAPLDWPPAGVSPAIASPVTLSGRRLGPYLLREEIGRGGMAVVYRAERADGAFAQEVAVKVLGIGLLALGGGERFRREQQVLSRLRHPNVATMLDGGVAADGTPWLAMEILAGEPLDAWCAKRRSTPAERVALLQQVCSAVAFAHRNLVVHRDLKPSNVLVDALGHVKLLDFGIAKLVAAESGEGEATVAPVRFLTPGYAAPEQVAGEVVTTATDVFALGRLLERLLAIEPRVADRDLDNIARQAMRSEPELRYPDASALAADLERWRNGRPVVATGNSLAYRLRKAARRHRAALAALAVVVAVAVTGLVATLAQASRARRGERTAATVNAFLVDLFHASDPERARGDDPRASELLRRGAERARGRLAGEPALQAQLLHVIGSIQREIGELPGADESLSHALALRSRHLPAGDAELAATRVELGLTRYELGRVDEAVGLLREALAALERSLDPADVRRLDAEVRLGDMLVVKGDYAEARRRMESVLARIGDRRDELVDLALDGEYTLAVALGELGEADAADRRLRGVIAEERRRSGLLARPGSLPQRIRDDAARRAGRRGRREGVPRGPRHQTAPLRAGPPPGGGGAAQPGDGAERPGAARRGHRPAGGGGRDPAAAAWRRPPRAGAGARVARHVVARRAAVAGGCVPIGRGGRHLEGGAGGGPEPRRGRQLPAQLRLRAPGAR